MRKRIIFGLALLNLAASSCTSYYGLTAQFNKLYESDRYEESMTVVDKTKTLTNNNNAVLGDLNYATAAFWNKSYDQSIERFAKADDYIDGYSTHWGKEALALLSNPSVTPYKPEHFEEVMLHFYQAINYIALHEYEDAMVECRRMNLTLNRLSDKYRRDDHKHYARDAFGHYVMGILYETLDNANDAFIAYRNALEAYESDYAPLFATPLPKSLQKAVVRSAQRAGLRSEARTYSERFGIESDFDPRQGRLIAFVLQGFAPVKEQKSFTFVRAGGGVGFFNYSCAEAGLTVPVDFGNRDASNDLKIVSLTLPKFTTRSLDMPVHLTINGVSVPTEMVENLNAIAPQSLSDRLWAELGKAIARMVTKQVINNLAEDKDPWLGLFVSIFNAATEQADTRYWQSLPAFIKIVNLPLDEGDYYLQTSPNGPRKKVHIERGKTSFATFKVNN